MRGAQGGTGLHGDRLRRARLAARFSQEELAERCGLSVRTISDLERGRTRHPYPSTLRLLAAALDLTDAAARELLDVRPADEAPPPPAGVPRQLPSGVHHFVGRDREQQALHALIDAADADDAGPVICVVTGTAGIGKTTLAVHWARQVAHRFPDGQLYVNLGGFGPTGSAVSPAEAITRFLDALDVPLHRIPADLDAQANLYRTLLATRRMVILLDNARDAEQLRPLLPGSSGCVVMVTSRDPLTPLIAAEDARAVALELLSATEARDLLTQRLGADRVAAEPDAVATIIVRCARLPLALAVVAAHATTHSHRALGAIADELTLAMLSAGDPVTDVRTVFSWSYRALPADAARLFRLMGLQPGPDASITAAASLAGLPPGEVRPLLAELVRANLLVEHGPGRYTFHDLLRAYAIELVHAVESDDLRRAATHRILDHYLRTAEAAAMLLSPSRDPIRLPQRPAGTTAETFGDDGRAVAWFTAEHANLLPALDRAARQGFRQHAWQLAWTLVNFLERRGRWHDLATVQRAGLTAAEHLDDPRAEALMGRYLGSAALYLGRLDEGRAHLIRALEVSRRSRNVVEHANIHLNLAWMEEKRNNNAEALVHARRALELFRSRRHRRGTADALNYVGWLQALLGDYPEALPTCRRALALYRQIGERHGQGAALDSLGYIQHHLGDLAGAITHYQESLAAYREVGDRYFETNILDHLAETYRAAGDLVRACDTWRLALTILTDLGHPDADTIRAKMSSASRIPAVTYPAGDRTG